MTPTQEKPEIQTSSKASKSNIKGLSICPLSRWDPLLTCTELWNFLNKWMRKGREEKCTECLLWTRLSSYPTPICSNEAVLLKESTQCIVCTKHNSVLFSLSVMSNSLSPHEPQHTRPPCPSPTPRVYPNSCPLSQWCQPTISRVFSNTVQKHQFSSAQLSL